MDNSLLLTYTTETQKVNRILKRRPCTFGQSLWYTNCPVNFSFFLVDQKKIWSTKKTIGTPKRNMVDQKNIWYTKKKFSDQKNEKWTGQLVYQRDWPKVHLMLYPCIGKNLLTTLVTDLFYLYSKERRRSWPLSLLNIIFYQSFLTYFYLYMDQT